MITEPRERLLSATFVALADTLVAGYDVRVLRTLVESSADLLDASGAGLLLADDSGGLSVVGSTSESSRQVDQAQRDSGVGPSIDCFTTGLVVQVADIEASADKWHLFAAEAQTQGFRSAHIVPLRLRADIIGTLNLLNTETGLLESEEAAVAQALADIATIGILHERALRESTQAREQLQHALSSRVLIEQAKGAIAQRREIGMDEAFRRLRSYARANGVPLREVAQRVVDRSVSP